MSETTNSYTYSNLRLSQESRGKEEIFQDIADNLIDNTIYAKCGKEYAGGNNTGWLQRDNLLSKTEAQEWIAQNGNIGIALGKWFDDVTYVAFDIEEETAIDDLSRSIIDTHSVLKYKTKHGNLNRIVPIREEEAYDLLRSYGETHTHLTDGEDDDIEILTKGAAIIPPSSVNHTHCTDNKPCDRRDRITQYKIDLISDGKPFDYDTVEWLGELLELEAESTEEEHYPDRDLGDIPPVKPTKNVLQEWKNNVPSVSHSFEERTDYMLWENWDGRDDFFELWQGNFDSIAGSNPQGKAEAKIVNTISFFFGRNQEIIKYFMDILPFDTHFSKYPSHRKQLLEWSQNVTWCYCEGVSFMTKHHVATGIYYTEASTVEEITQETNTGQRQVERALNILEAEGVIQTVNESKNRRVVTECNITEGYIDELEEITYKYEEVKQKESSNPNIRRVTI